MSELPENIPLCIVDSSESPSLFITHHRKWAIDLPSFLSFEWNFFNIDSPKVEHPIFGCCFLNNFNPFIYFKNGLITYNTNHKDSNGLTPSYSGGSSTGFNSVSLVGELETPSLPSSVYITPIIPSYS
ncbi:hypothetical protein O181_007151 [Austropuccinia psidii MF-1]|uniref:Uncharacterized protein n=1 Tax=Austropuccinia psidii MF-1 TaxID=1389203 RepID=A0A9Q3BM89_9BASI|nr:hypothetical protein [Austropuccinia psidii MF-1]